MKIIVNTLQSGLGNNGGTKTLVRSAEAMQDLGHEVYIACESQLNKFTWFTPKVKILPHLEKCDLLIATACITVLSTLRGVAKRKAYYIRGHETWNQSDEQLLRGYRSGLINIVNSVWLKELLSSYGISSKVVYPGLDFDVYYDEKLRNKSTIRIGALYSPKHKTKRWDKFVELTTKYKNNTAIEFVAFGSGNKHKEVTFLKEYLKNPSESSLRKFYSKCHIWYSATELEGLHIPPEEAALCGAACCLSNKPSAGNKDYAVFGKTAVELNDIDKLIEDSSFRGRIIKNMQELLKEHIGSRKENMAKFLAFCR